MPIFAKHFANALILSKNQTIEIVLNNHTFLCLKSCRILNTITSRFMKPWNRQQKMIIIFHIHLFIFRQIAQLV